MDAGMYEAGMQVRREVLGNDYVDQAVRSTDDFNRPFQELITEFCWGACWTRPGLERRTRSMLNLAMLTALGRSHELKLHLRGALRNGVSREEIREVLIQASIYAGIPAGVEAFRCAREVFAEADEKPSD
jgi:4-carboxymuconolactone decarboxylase